MSSHYKWVGVKSLYNHMPFGLQKFAILFKWQWAVFWEEKSWATEAWNEKLIIAESRSAARHFMGQQKYRAKVNPTHSRNVRMKRRLVQAHWEDYQDSFTYNAKGNGNGR